MAIDITDNLYRGVPPPLVNEQAVNRKQPIQANGLAPQPNLNRRIHVLRQISLEHTVNLEKIRLSNRCQITALDKQIGILNQQIINLQQNGPINQTQILLLGKQIGAIREQINALEIIAATPEEAVEIAERFQIDPPENAEQIDVAAQGALANVAVANQGPVANQPREAFPAPVQQTLLTPAPAPQQVSILAPVLAPAPLRPLEDILIRTWETSNNREIRVVQRGERTLVCQLFNRVTDQVSDSDVSIQAIIGDYYTDRRYINLQGTFDLTGLNERVEILRDQNLKFPYLYRSSQMNHYGCQVETRPVDNAIDLTRIPIRRWDIPGTNETLRLVQIGEKALFGELFDRATNTTLGNRMSIATSRCRLTGIFDLPALNERIAIAREEDLNFTIIVSRPRGDEELGLIFIKKDAV